MEISKTSIVDDNKSTEKILLQQIYQGDKSAFWQLWNQHKDYLYKHCVRWMNNNYTDAEEAISISMLKAWEKLPKYALKVTNARAWLTRVTYNLCVDIHRKKAYNLSIEANGDSEDFLLDSRIDSPETIILRNELRKLLYHLINTLPKNLQIPVILKFIQEKNYREISAILNIPEHNVRKRIQKGRVLLKAAINEYIDGCENCQNLNLEENENNAFYLSNLSNFTIEQSANLKSNFQKIREQDLETLIYRLSATNLETLPHKHSSLNCSLNWY